MSRNHWKMEQKSLNRGMKFSTVCEGERPLESCSVLRGGNSMLWISFKRGIWKIGNHSDREGDLKLSQE